MRVTNTPQMDEMWEYFAPYLDPSAPGAVLKAGAPKEAVEKYNQYFKLLEQHMQEAEEMM